MIHFFGRCCRQGENEEPLIQQQQQQPEAVGVTLTTLRERSATLLLHAKRHSQLAEESLLQAQQYAVDANKKTEVTHYIQLARLERAQSVRYYNTRLQVESVIMTLGDAMQNYASIKHLSSASATLEQLLDANPSSKPLEDIVDRWRDHVDLVKEQSSELATTNTEDAVDVGAEVAQLIENALQLPTTTVALSKPLQTKQAMLKLQ